jgi:tetratricopeptide (TPR) repeat protein/class 3 adenylate cyclase
MSAQNAILLTDIVGSTGLVQRLGDEIASSVWQAYERSARSLLVKWRGREIDKSDGLLVLFSEVSDALGFAQDHRLVLCQLRDPLVARTAIHFGPLLQRSNPDTEVAHGAKPIEADGLAKHLAARILDIAQPDEILLSAAAVAALPDRTDRLLPHGVWKCKGIDDPVELFCVGDRTLATPFQTSEAWQVELRDDVWVPLAPRPNTLPADRDSFVGRNQSLVHLADAFEAGARLVSVIGPGGVGKTRLATRFGRVSLGGYPGGVWFCDLSAATTLEGIVHAAAQGLDLAATGRQPLQDIADAIAGRGRCLVVLDNFEQVASCACSSLGLWLDRAPLARFLVTSRQVLSISGERVFHLPPLSIEHGVALFLLRAEAALGEKLAVEERAELPQLVASLDGLPLAVELAAARVPLISPREMIQRMRQRFSLLSFGDTRHDRHATLEASLDWSWELLTPEERSALKQLTVFEGGFDLPAAEAVVWAAHLSPVVDLVHALMRKSLLCRLSRSRIGMLTSIHEYAQRHAMGDSETREACVRHWLYFADQEVDVPVSRILPDADNIVAACRRAIANADAAASVRTLQASWRVLRQTGPLAVAAQLSDAVCQLLPAGERRAEAYLVAGSAKLGLGMPDAAGECLRHGLSECGENHALTVRILCAMADLRRSTGDVANDSDELARALHLIEGLDQPLLRCQLFNELGTWEQARGRLDAARQYFSQALEVSRQAGDRRWQAGVLGNLGVVEHDLGHGDAAKHSYEASIALSREVRDKRWEGNALCNLGLLMHEAGDADSARLHFEDSIAIARHIGSRYLEAVCLCNLGICLTALDRIDEAESKLKKTIDVARQLQDRRLEGQAEGYLAAAMFRAVLFDKALACVKRGLVLIDAAGDTVSRGVLYCIEAEIYRALGVEEGFETSLTKAREALISSGASESSELGRRFAALGCHGA